MHIRLLSAKNNDRKSLHQLEIRKQHSKLIITSSKTYECYVAIQIMNINVQKHKLFSDNKICTTGNPKLSNDHKYISFII